MVSSELEAAPHRAVRFSLISRTSPLGRCNRQRPRWKAAVLRPRIFAVHCFMLNRAAPMRSSLRHSTRRRCGSLIEGYDDEIRFVRDVLNTSAEASEFNVLGNLWNARVTSHIPLSQVSAAISERAIARAATLADRCMRSAGFRSRALQLRA